MTTIISTQYKLPQSIVGNGVTTGNEFSDPNNILMIDGDVANSQVGTGEASDIIVGNFNFNVPVGSVITGIRLKLVAERGAQTVPDITVTPVLVNDLSGTNEYYPGDAYAGLTEQLEDHILGNQYDLWGKSSWTVDEINNLKVQLVASGDVRPDCILGEVFYYDADEPLPPDPISVGCEDCNSTIEALPFTLAKTFRVDETKFILKSFALIDGTPIDLSMLGDCGGEITITFDQGKEMLPGQNFQEDAVITSADATITTLSNGFVEIDLGTITNRGLLPIKPYTHNAELLSEHAVGTKVIISNSARYQNRFLQKCHIGVLVSAPIKTFDEGNEVVSVTEEYNFQGDNVQAEQDALNPKRANVIFVNNPTNVTPEEEDTSTGTTGTTPATTLGISHTVTDANYLRISIQTDIETISSVIYNGVPASFVASKTNPGADLKVAVYDLINPTAGVHNLVITMASPSNITAQVTGWIDVDTTDPIDGISTGSFGTGTAPSDSLTTTSQNSIVQDVVGSINNPTTFAQYGLWSILGHVDSAARTGATSSRRVLIPQLVLDQYTIAPSTSWAMIMVGIRGQAYAPVAGVQSVTGYWVDNSDPANPVVIAPKTIVSTANPTVSDDNTQGYSINSTWFNKNTDTMYVATAVTTGAAVWEAIVGSGSDTYTVKVTNADTTPSFLDDKIENVSTDGSVTISESIINPGANEVKRFDFSVPPLASGIGFNYLPLGKYYSDTGNEQGNPVVNNVFTNSSNRVYAAYVATSGSQTTRKHNLRIFNKTHGTYFIEREITVSLSDLSDTNGTAIDTVSWFGDDNYIYAIVRYIKSTSTTFNRIDVLRYSIDGTSPTATNIFAQSPTVTNTQQYSLWNNSASPHMAATIVGNSFFTTWSVRTGASTYTDQLREYTISGTTYTLANTYTVTTANNTERSFNLNYDATNDCFYFGCMDTSQVPGIDKYVISGSNIGYDSTTTYSEFAFGNNRVSNSEDNTGYNISQIEDNVSYNKITVVQDETGGQSGSSPNNDAHSYRMMTYNMPKF